MTFCKKGHSYDSTHKNPVVQAGGGPLHISSLLNVVVMDSSPLQPHALDTWDSTEHAAILVAAKLLRALFDSCTNSCELSSVRKRENYFAHEEGQRRIHYSFIWEGFHRCCYRRALYVTNVIKEATNVLKCLTSPPPALRRKKTPHNTKGATGGDCQKHPPVHGAQTASYRLNEWKKKTNAAGLGCWRAMEENLGERQRAVAKKKKKVADHRLLKNQSGAELWSGGNQEATLGSRAVLGLWGCYVRMTSGSFHKSGPLQAS